MSMTKQLWSAIIVSMLLALCGSLFASLLSARGYLSEQLTLKNIDNANALALALSQNDVDNVKIELAATALFDSGQYQLIRVVDPRGRVIVEKTAPFGAQTGMSNSPQWFASILPITAAAGTAQISSGWKQLGTLTLQSESRFAYRSLWRSALQMTAALAFSCLFAGYLGSLILRRLIPPLNDVVNQAKGITERRFTTIAPPRVPELAKLAEAMNLMVTRLRSMFEHEAGRLETLRREANFDTVTGLANRDFFMAQLAQSITDSATDNQLILLRIAQLADINQQLGRASTDELLKAVGARITALGIQTNLTLNGRLSGADFALLGTAQKDVDLGKSLLNAVMMEAPRFGLDPEHFVHIGSVFFAPGSSMNLVLAQADAALANAEAGGRSSAVSNTLDVLENSPRSAREWEEKLRNALHNRQVRLEAFPVVDMQGNVIGHECPLRLRFDEADSWHPAGRFVPLAERLRITATLDIMAIELGIEALNNGTHAGNLVLNLSPQSIADAGFRHDLVALLGQHRTIATKLWLEVAESGALLHLDELTQLCRELAPLGCHIGIEHFGHQFSQIGRLYQSGLHYLKMDSSFISGIDYNVGNQAFLQGVRSITRVVGLQLHAEGVATEAEFRQLALLGFDAATGPGIRAS